MGDIDLMKRSLAKMSDTIEKESSLYKAEEQSIPGSTENISEEYEKKEKKNEQYQKYIDGITPRHKLAGQLCRAFLTGGLICLFGQFLLNLMTGRFGISSEDAAVWCSISLIFLTDLLTGFGIYPKIVKWGGAGALVPITGFANSISSSAVEYKKEGWVFGVGCKIFTIAGPVILYGVFVSWILGILYWLIRYQSIF